MSKTAFITMDVESYYDTMCLKNSDVLVDQQFNCASEITRFLSFLYKEGIKATFFVTISFLPYCKEFLLEAIKKGHEIALHAYEHESLTNISVEDFDILLKKSKEIILRELGVVPFGFRFPCFEYRQELIDVLNKNGFLYDSSVYLSDIKEHQRIDDVTYLKDCLYEIPLMDRKFLGQIVLISGGGYMRMFPTFVTKRWIKKYIKNHDGYNFYFHPFEIYEKELPLPNKCKGRVKYYLNKGRKTYLKYIEYIVHFLKENDYQFSTISEHLKSVK